MEVHFIVMKSHARDLRRRLFFFLRVVILPHDDFQQIFAVTLSPLRFWNSLIVPLDVQRSGDPLMFGSPSSSGSRPPPSPPPRHLRVTLQFVLDGLRIRKWEPVPSTGGLRTHSAPLSWFLFLPRNGSDGFDFPQHNPDYAP